jgi:putative selenium metabolism protein SsnA
MTDSVILHNGLLVTAFPGGRDEGPDVYPEGAVLWRGDRIEAVGVGSELLPRYPNATQLDAGGGIILPGMVNLHHHFYSALARGMDPGTRMSTFAEVLDRLWWRLDRALDRDTVRLSAQLSLAECIRWGCTTVFDHHASPGFIAGSLDEIADAVREAGLAAVLCYEITDRNGHDQALDGLAENLRFIGAHESDPRIRGLVGLHASFTLSDRTLARVADRLPEKSGVHIHVAEDPVDVDESQAAFGAGPVERLIDFGLLNERSILAHGIHLRDEDYRKIAEHNAVLVHNPESNANNSVGHLNTVNVARQGCLVGLGTDGMSSAMLRALRAAFLVHRQSTGDCSSGFDAIPELLHNNVRVARRLFEEPLLGVLAPGAPADIVVVDSPAATPFGRVNAFAHLAYGASEYPVRHTIARGKTLLQDFRFTTVDPVALARRAREVSPTLWKRFGELRWGTPYLGDESSGSK